jgi:hypothetical protein
MSYRTSLALVRKLHLFDSQTKMKKFTFLAAPTQKSPKGILLRGDVVEDVRIVFENLQDETVYIPNVGHCALV